MADQNGYRYLYEQDESLLISRNVFISHIISACLQPNGYYMYHLL
jgi:hypothetical protein